MVSGAEYPVGDAVLAGEFHGGFVSFINFFGEGFLDLLLGAFFHGGLQFFLEMLLLESEFRLRAADPGLGLVAQTALGGRKLFAWGSVCWSKGPERETSRVRQRWGETLTLVSGVNPAVALAGFKR